MQCRPPAPSRPDPASPPVSHLPLVRTAVATDSQPHRNRGPRRLSRRPDTPVAGHLEDTMKARILGTDAAALAIAAGSIVGATSAAAQDNVRGAVSFPADVPVVECSGGVGI